MADLKVRLECTCGAWQSNTLETNSVGITVAKETLIDQAISEHPEATNVASEKGHYLQTMINFPDTDNEFRALYKR